MLLAINLLQAWGRRRRRSARTLDGRPGTSQDLAAEIATPARAATPSSALRAMAAFIALSLLFLAALLFAPLVTVFATALEKGFAAVLQQLHGPGHAAPRSA